MSLYEGYQSYQEPEATQEEPQVVDETEQEGPKRASRKRSRSKGASAPLRAVAEKAIELATAEEADLEVLSALFGKDDLSALAVAVQEAGKDAADPLESVRTARSSDDLTAGVEVAGLDPAGLKAVWGLAKALGADLGGIPSSAPAAAIALVKAVKALPADADRRIDSVASLAEKA